MILSLLLSISLMPGVALAEVGAVTGTLRGPDGSPAAQVRVGVMAMPQAGRGRPAGAGTLVSQVATDVNGRFQLEDVPPGRYYIVAGRLETPTFYPGVRDMGSAKLIQVVAKATVRDIDFVMSGTSVVPTAASVVSATPLPGVRVTGRIVLKNSGAQMPPNITLQIFPVAGGSPPVLAAATGNPIAVPQANVTIPIDPDGRFRADLVAADQHLSVVGLPPGYSLVSMTSGKTNLLTQPFDVKLGAELVVTLDVGDSQPRYRLVAAVRDDTSDRPLAGERIELVHASGEVVRLVVNAQGVVTFPGLLPGTYVLRLASAGFIAPEKQVVITDSSVQVELRPREKR